MSALLEQVAAGGWGEDPEKPQKAAFGHSLSCSREQERD